ncbi:Dolichyl-diphosphooligosaccharide--protein glycosyltransferase subunit 1A [Platanthera guangdongensis]|uniref:Dolichyl-diphosphooligosaccharide--protein glycosyltransferase subunit 1A n=1 Tax=Platanthera guangdongensis TaxID=2320717 RepID=A0ABR2LRD4_9ASPA
MEMRKEFGYAFFFFFFAVCMTRARSDLVISKLDRRIDLTSHVVRVLSTLKVSTVVTDPFCTLSALWCFADYACTNSAGLKCGYGSVLHTLLSLPYQMGPL